MEKPEAFYLSVRFWVSLLTPVFAAFLPAAVAQLPFVSVVSPEQWVALFAGGIVAGLTFVLARTFRNTKIAVK